MLVRWKRRVKYALNENAPNFPALVKPRPLDFAKSSVCDEIFGLSPLNRALCFVDEIVCAIFIYFKSRTQVKAIYGGTNLH